MDGAPDGQVHNRIGEVIVTAETPAGTVFDVVILGGGSGGYACALRAAHLGLTVALIEKDKLGGTCLHKGCIPTKALLHAAEVADSARESEQFGVRATFEGIDMPAVNSYRDGVVSRLYKGLQGLVKSRKITYVEAEGRLVSATAVEVDGQRYEGRHVVLATGSTPRSLPGLDDRRQPHPQLRPRPGARLRAELGRRPRRRRHRRRVRQRLEVLRRRRHDHRGACRTSSRSRTRRTPSSSSARSASAASPSSSGARFSGVEYTEKGVKVSTENGKSFEADLLLVAIGRGPVSDGPRLRGGRASRWSAASSRSTTLCQTNVPTVSAVGDLIPTLQLAHVGFGEGILVAERLAGLDVVPIDYDGVPRVTYSEPEVASVGLTEAAAKERYGATRSRPSSTTSPATARARSSRRRARSSSSGRRTGRSSASTWSAAGSASSSPRPS